MRIFIMMFLLLLTACQMGSDTVKEIEMYNASGDMVGTATFTEQEDGVQIKVKVTGLTPGFHGIHVHEYPKCEGPDFKSAGNHFNPEGKKHGLLHPDGAHLGDLPNIEADESGKVEAEIMAPNATLLEDDLSFLRGDGTSLVIHAGPDDGMSQPGGDAGERIVCGELLAESADDDETPTDPVESDKEGDESE